VYCIYAFFPASLFFNNCVSEGGCLFADGITLETRSLACSNVFVRKLLLFLSFMTKVILDNSSLSVGRQGHESLQFEIIKVNYVRSEDLRNTYR
jgi:hypothetical protein